MGQPLAKANDQVMATDIHIVMVPAGPSLVPTPLPHPFTGVLDGSLCATVSTGGTAVATVGSTATNTPAHVPTPPGASFQKPPANRATVQLGSATVTIGGQPAARRDQPLEHGRIEGVHLVGPVEADVRHAAGDLHADALAHASVLARPVPPTQPDQVARASRRAFTNSNTIGSTEMTMIASTTVSKLRWMMGICPK